MANRSLRYFLPSYGILMREFRDGARLAWAHHQRRSLDCATFWDGQRVRNAGRRAGFVDTLVEMWGLQEYTRGGFYEPRDGDVVLDLGANIGLFSIWLARHAPQATVHAYEPFAENYDAMCANLHGWRHRIQPRRAAVGASAGTGVMLDAGERSLDHRLVATSDQDGGVRVDVVALDDAVEATGARMIDLLKIDIEGAEGDVLAAASPQTLRRIRRVALEYHDNLRPGTLQRVKDTLAHSHRILDVVGGDYGILHAEIVSA